MPTLSITKTYDDGSVLSESDLDGIKSSIETFLNTTRIADDNIQTGGVSAANLATSAVTTAKLDTGAVTTAKLGDDSVTAAKAGLAIGAAAVANGIIACSVGSNALTIALKTKAGTDPSASDITSIAFRSATLTSGAYNHRQVTAALSTVISSGSTGGHTSAVEWPLYIYALDYNFGTIELAWSTSPVDERYLQTTTAEGGAGAADSAAVLYSTTARTSVPVRLLAVLKSTQTTAGTWAAVPTTVSSPTSGSPLSNLVARPAVSSTAGIGGVAVSASCGTFTLTGPAGNTDITNLSVTITTTGRPVQLKLEAVTGVATSYVELSDGGAGGTANVIFVRDGSEIILMRLDSSGSMYTPSCFSYLDIGATAGTHTYKIQGESSNADDILFVECKLVAYEI